MTDHITDISQQTAVKIAGWAYLLIILTSILSMVLGPYRFMQSGDIAITFNNLVAHELSFRLDTAYGLIMFASVVVLAVALYVILKPVNKTLAFLAMLWRVAEAVLGCLMILSSLIVLLLIDGGNYAAVFDTGQLHALVGLFLDLNLAALSMLFVFIGLGTIVNCYLFYKSQYIPRILASVGIFAFSLVLIAALGSIIVPDKIATVDIIAKAVATLWEIAIGLWLIIKGINVEQWEKRALESG